MNLLQLVRWYQELLECFELVNGSWRSYSSWDLVVELRHLVTDGTLKDCALKLLCQNEIRDLRLLQFPS